MKKFFFQITTVFLFIMGVYMLPVHKASASPVAWISASSTSVKDKDTVTITYGSTGASYCTTNFNSSSATSGSYTYQASISQPSRTFSVSCTMPPTTSCYLGFWESPDPVHPDGGRVTYTADNGQVYTETGIWNDRAATITYRAGTVPSAQGAHSVTCPTGSWSYASACPTTCGYSGGTQTQTCTGGNSLCDGSASSRTCAATVACPSSCKGRAVIGSTECDGPGNPGADEGISCSYFTTKEACNPSSCSSWFHHGCTWN